jgi:hypothetical protein
VPGGAALLRYVGSGIRAPFPQISALQLKLYSGFGSKIFSIEHRGHMTTENDSELSQEIHTLLDSSKSTSEAFSIIATELIEVKAMLMTLIDLQKSALFATGVNENELEVNVQNLLNGYRSRFFNGLSSQIKAATEQQ